MPEQTIDIKRRFPEGAIFVPPARLARPTLGQRFLRIVRLSTGRFLSRPLDLTISRKQPINLKPVRPYDWGRYYKPPVAAVRREWLTFWATPRRLPLLVLVGLRRCFIIFVLVALSFYAVLGGSSVLASTWQKQQALAPLAEQIVTDLEEALEKIMAGQAAQASQALTTVRQNLSALRAGFGGVNTAAALLNQSRFGLALLALRLGDELLGGIETIALAINHLQRLEFKPALAATDLVHQRLIASQKLLALVDQEGLSDDQLSRLNQLHLALKQSERLFAEVKQLAPVLLKLSGSPDPTKILVLFQNTGEARATGGFIGAFALLGFNEGKVSQFTVHDSYDFDGRLFQAVKAPPFLRPYVNNVALRDSNHDPDFPTSAKLASWFLEQEKGPTVDAVLAVDEQFLRKLLTLSGPIFLPSFGVTVDTSNFYLLLEYLIETNKDHPQTPKQVLVDLVGQIINRLGEQPRPLSLLTTTLELISQKRILLYTSDTQLSTAAAKLGLSGNFPPALQPKEDFLAVFTTALSGNKSDYFLTTIYNHQTEISAKGKLTNRLEIERSHRFGEQEEQFVRRQPGFAKEQRLAGGRLLDTLGAGRNQELIRVLVPLGSRLVSTHGVSIDDVTVREEVGWGLTSFEFLQTTARGDTSKVALRYELPFSLSPEQYALYRLRLYQQPGQATPAFQKEIKTAGQSLYYLNNQEGLARTTTYNNVLALSNDHVFAIIVSR